MRLRQGNGDLMARYANSPREPIPGCVGPFSGPLTAEEASTYLRVQMAVTRALAGR
jgi:hypothetical protein